METNAEITLRGKPKDWEFTGKYKYVNKNLILEVKYCWQVRVDKYIFFYDIISGQDIFWAGECDFIIEESEIFNCSREGF